MPVFSTAKVLESASNVDVTEYEQFLIQYTPGAKIELDLADGEKSRIVMRNLNKAADRLSYKLYRVSSNENKIVFRIMRVRGPRQKKVASTQVTITAVKK
jgi:hypothetical protein